MPDAKKCHTKFKNASKNCFQNELLEKQTNVSFQVQLYNTMSATT